MNILDCCSPAQALRLTLGHTVTDMAKIFGGTRKLYGEMEADGRLKNRIRANALKGVYADYKDKIDCLTLPLEGFWADHLDMGHDETCLNYLADQLEANAPGAEDHYRPILTIAYFDESGGYIRDRELSTEHLVKGMEELFATYSMLASSIISEDYFDLIVESEARRADIAEERDRVQALAFFVGKESLKRHLITEQVNSGLVRLTLNFEGAAAYDTKRAILGVEDLDAFSWEERVNASTNIPNYETLLEDKAGYADDPYSADYMSFVQSHDDYLLFVLKRVTAMVVARNGHRVFARMINIAENGEINEIILMKTMASIRKEIGETLREIEGLLGEDFSNILLVAAQNDLAALQA